MRLITTPEILKLVGAGKLFTDGFRPGNLSAQDTYTFSLGASFTKVFAHGLIDAGSRDDVRFITQRLAPEGETMHPGQFLHFKTAEILDLDARIICLLSTHRKMAELGLDFLQSSTLVQPGSKGRLTLETSNRGPCTVLLKPGLKVVKAMFFDIN
ncbi:MAG: hypothetical protein U9Q03_01625 [Patescibacteria group bacterium]|nr:hypothetical protein [Patescibacteria group bacterium]